jgi:hypothetical protein
LNDLVSIAADVGNSMLSKLAEMLVEEIHKDLFKFLIRNGEIVAQSTVNLATLSTIIELGKPVDRLLQLLVSATPMESLIIVVGNPFTPQGSWLSFVEGNPGIPGDGIFLNYNIPASFSLITSVLSSPIELGDLNNGFTVTIFLSPNFHSQQKLYVWLEVGKPVNPPYCWSKFGPCMLVSPEGSFCYGVTFYNGVKGYIVNISRSILEYLANIMNPTCAINVSEMILNGIGLYPFEEIPVPEIVPIDAVYFAPGQNAVP